MSLHCQYRTAVPSVQLLVPASASGLFLSLYLPVQGRFQLQPVSLGSSACFRLPRSPSESLSSEIQSLSCIFIESSFFPVFFVQIIVMVRTRGGSRFQPRVRFSIPEREASAPAPAPVPAPVPSPVPEAVPEEPQGLRRYQRRMGPRAPSPVARMRVRRARPSKRASTSGPGESSSSRPPPSPVASVAEATSSPQLSPASRIRRPMFVGNPIPGNARLHRRPFHQESCYDVPALRADPRYRESMRLIEDYSLLPFMTPRQHYYPRVVLQFYQSMTSRGADGPLELQFSIDDRPGVLRAADISAALGLRIPPHNSEGYRAWAHPPHRDMVRALARDTTAGPVFYRRQLLPQMLLIDHLFRTSLFPLQHYVRRMGAILEALYRISRGFWFSPSELVMSV